MYYIYIIRCEGGSLYTGITSNMFSRMAEHTGKKKSAAKYTKSHTVRSLEALWSSCDRSSASRLEAAIKKLKKREKEALIASPREFSRILPALDKEDYVRHPLATLALYLGPSPLSHLP